MALGTTSPDSYDGNSNNFVIANTSGNAGMSFVTSSSGDGTISWADGTSGNERYRGSIGYNHTNDKFTISTAASSAVTIDSSGRLLVGTTSNTAPGAFNAKIQTASTSFDGSISLRRDSNNTGSQSLVFGKSRGSLNGNTIVQSGDSLGSIVFCGADGTDLNTAAAQIIGSVDGTPGANDMPGRISFWTTSDGAASSTERMRIDQQGRLIINHTSNIAPDGYASKLQLCDTSYQGSSVVLRRDQSNGSGPTVILAKSRSSSKGGNTIVQDGDDCGSIRWYGNDGVDQSNELCRIRGVVSGTPGSNDMPGALTFWTTPDGSNSTSERLRIDSSGVVKINQSATANIFRIQNTTSNESSMLIQNSTTGLNAGNGLYIGIGGDETSYFWAYHNENMTFATNNTARMTIFAGGKLRVPGVYAGTTTGGSAVYVESDGDLLRYTSSLKYKTDVETIEDAKADAILNCRPVWYRSKCANDIKTEGSEKSDWGWYGFIAEEVAEIEPRLVNWATKDAVRQEDGNVESVERDPADYEAEGIRYDNFVPLLVNLAKRQKAQIDALEARISALEG